MSTSEDYQGDDMGGGAGDFDSGESGNNFFKLFGTVESQVKKI